MPTKKVAVDVELFAKSPWVRKRLARKEVLLWTVNDKKYISKLNEWSIAGLITDQPDLFS
jgi:glycerophosphoryl diester phosphodiesterase